MKIAIELIKLTDKEILKKLLKEYLIEMHGGGEGEYPWLDSYWQQPNRFPYFIKADGEIAGFALINEYSIIEPNVKNISEFYILPEYRRHGIGKQAAFMIWDMFPGKWEGRQIKENPKAHNYWLRVKGEYTNQNFKDQFIDNETWSGWIQNFDTTNK